MDEQFRTPAEIDLERQAIEAAARIETAKRQAAYYKNTLKPARAAKAAEKKRLKQEQRDLEQAEAESQASEKGYWTNLGQEENAAAAKARAVLLDHYRRQKLIANELTPPITPWPTKLLEDGVNYQVWFDNELRIYLKALFGDKPDFTSKWNIFQSLSCTGFGRNILTYLGATDAQGLRPFFGKVPAASPQGPSDRGCFMNLAP